MKFLLLVLLIVLALACGDNSPFDEDYWDSVDGDSRSEEADRNNGRFSVVLSPLSAIGFVQGSAAIDLNGNDAVLTVQMEGVPSNIIQGNIITITGTCEDIISNPPTTGSIETRNWTFTENGTRGALFEGLTTSESVESRSLVINAFSRNPDSDTVSSLFPFACGPIIRPTGDDGAGPDAPSSAAGATGGGTTVVTNGGTTFGTTGTNATTGGGVTTVGGVAGGTTVGGTAAGTTVGGEIAGGVGGGTVGGVGGTPGGVNTTGGVNTNTGGVGGTPGGVTTTGGVGGTFAF